MAPSVMPSPRSSRAALLGQKLGELAIGTSRSTKACPMPRTSTSASLPPFTFLSWAMSLSSSSGVGGMPGMSAMRPGRPTSARCRSTRADVVGRAKALLGGEGEGKPHADGDGLAVQEPV